MGADGALTRWLWALVGAGLVALVAAFVPSPLRVFDLFDAPATISVRKPPPLKLRDMPPASAFAEVVARPIFNAGRKPDPAARSANTSPSATGADQGDLSEFRLVGIVVDSTTQRAIVERSGSPSMRLAPGDRLAGWRIDKIDAAGIVASKDARSIRIGMPKARPRPPGTTSP